ncbi:GDP-mannose mannosyl hydrolase [Aeromonas bestiarum]|uniref:GDP-mannose mannosyl hydrolase n=1 Tax=Aeromonas bestiarum TaxID=105751 RepID=A0A068FSZ9_9GAMM|nr:GDP-mannose mannosyl hydrolase [Aeromonas bestiarum]AID70964.1 GDP-mannose mannosyl hydrolase [Aeromonas bestiarum]POG24550.1 GDP-mannose mannosyl hydrolase [Aeromonas bestiarum]
MSKKLDLPLFKTIVAHTPLVSLDLIVLNRDGKVLLGQRLNRPAQGYWFVPGGRIRKDEPFNAAFLRLTSEELGVNVSLTSACFLGAYQHFYPDNFSGCDFSTHYVVLGYQLILDESAMELPIDQHDAYRWFDIAELLTARDVHQHTKDYFIERI